jgi:hypothetical protein
MKSVIGTPCIPYCEENKLNKIEAASTRQQQASVHQRTIKRCAGTAPDGRYLDDHCNGDLEWEKRMKLLNPNWNPTDSALWDVWHE